MPTKTVLLLMASVIGVCVTVAWALDQQIYHAVSELRTDIREVLKILLEWKNGK